MCNNMVNYLTIATNIKLLHGEQKEHQIKQSFFFQEVLIGKNF